MAWTVAGARVGFLVLDRNGNGVIDSLDELFGQAVSGSRRRPGGTANSFADLAAMDLPENGGNGDGLMSAADAVFAGLRLWVDANHDGVSQPGEFVTLAQAGVASIKLGAQPIARRDRFGNYFKYRAVVHLADGRRTMAWDVFLAARLNGSALASAAGPARAAGSRPGPLSPGLAGLGVALIAVGLAGLVRPRRRTAAVARVGVTGFTTVAVVLLWPVAGFGQAPQVVEYYDTDALGSVRAVSNAQGQLIARHDFLPFGEELAPQSPPADKKLFTGQERDFETGQDYFNARQLRTDLGRFLIVDPASIGPGAFLDPQLWNRYAYGKNNPLRFVDANGRWPKEIHRLIFDMALPRLTAEQLDLMASGSAWADDWRGDHAHSFAHGMRDGTINPQQSVEQAQTLYEGWVGSYLESAHEHNSYWDFGVAGHAIEDTFSPPHRGFQGWPGFGLSSLHADWDHRAMEASLDLILGSELEAMLQAIREAFFEAFGSRAHTQATGYLYSRPRAPMSVGLPTVTPTKMSGA